MARYGRLQSDHLTFRDLSHGAIRHWRLVMVGATGLTLLGAMAWRSIPRLEEPRIDVPGMSVSLVYPGASPEDVETQVIKPLEEELYELTGVKSVEAFSYPGVAIFAVEFDDDVNMDVMTERARGRLMGRKRDLPAEVKDPDVRRWTTSRTPQMVIAVTGHAADRTLTAQAKRLKTVLTTVAGVAGVDLTGVQERAVRVRLDPVRLARHRLTAEQVARQLQLMNVRIPGGEYDVGPLTTLLEINHEYTDAASVARTPVGASADERGATQTVALGDVADVHDGTLNVHRRFMYEGQPAVGLQLRFRSGTDAVAVGRDVRAALEHFRPTLPAGVGAVVCHDQPQWISDRVHSFIESLLEGMALVMLVITLGMGLRAAVVVAGVIPLAVGGAVLGLYLLGFSLETITIGGLIVALGLLVDDAVVVTESVQIMRDKGLSAFRAAVFGTGRVFWANNGTTAVAIASFLPLFAMGGDTGQYIKGLPTAVILCLATSLLVAQLFTPWVATFFLRKHESVPDIADDQPYDRTLDRSEGAYGERNPALLLLRRLYTAYIPWVVRNPGKVVSGALLLLVAALSLMWFDVIGFQFFPKADKRLVFVTLELPKGARLEHTAEKVTEALARIREDPAVFDTSATLGVSYPPIFASRMSRLQGGHLADMLVRLKPGEDATLVAPRMRRRLADLVGVNVSIEELAYGPPITHPVLVRVYGGDYAELRRVAEEVKAKLRTLPGTINISDSLSESMPLTRVRLDVDRALRTGITPAQVGQTLRFLHGEDKITEFRRGEDLVEVVLESPAEPSRPMAALGDTLVPGAGGLVALKDAGRVSLGYGFAQLNRRNTQRVVEIWSDLEAGALTSSVIGELEPYLRSRTWPPGYGFTYGGEQEETAESFRKLGVAAVGAILLIFLLLLLMFDNILLSVLVIIAVPFALVGALPGLALTGNPFGFMAFLGLIALIGVYVNHKIYFVDRMLVLMHRGEDLATAILHAGQDRLRPVVLTALTAVLGLVPLTLSGRMWGSFGWVNVFGLVASIPLSLVLLPAFIALAFRLTGRWRPGEQRRFA